VTIRKSYGFNTYQAQRVMLFHTVGELPMPDLAHKFFWRANYYCIGSDYELEWASII